MSVHCTRTPVVSGSSEQQLQHQAIMKSYILMSSVSPISSVYGVNYYNQFIVQFSVYVHDILFTGINRSTVSGRCGILEVGPMDTLFKVALSSTHHISSRSISLSRFNISVIQYSGVIPRKAVTMIMYYK